MNAIEPTVFSNDEITVTYQPCKCINAERCAKELSNVFRHTVIPWINLDGASSNKIIEQVKKCPSGALQYYQNENKDVA
ncbi:(4Fe-4S)-binding protein [Winogradskyella sp. 3972H.M.0a.05]|uniref:(4Fe-4S)-binding protein n=1 Tax=Winogradskyella sp. 3972H.M.0a.05 TaxID=2950277 RepID=UPI003397CEFF